MENDSSEIPLIDDFNKDGLLFVNLEKGKKKERQNDDDFRFAVFDERGHYVNLAFSSINDADKVIIDKIVSPQYLTSKKMLKKTLNINENSFMTLKEAKKRKYFETYKHPIVYNKKCQCLQSKDEAQPNTCDIETCISPSQIFISDKKFQKIP